MTIYINGRFLTKEITGVQRFAIEVVKQLDKMNLKEKIIILTPKNIKNKLELKNIEICTIGKLTGNLWEQISLPIFLCKKRAYKLLNLCNLGPILNPGYVTIHDIAFKTNSKHLNWKFALYYRFITKLNIKRYKHIYTVSEFSKNEILQNYKIDAKKVTVVYNSAEHIKNLKEDFTILRELEIENKDFVFSLGSKSYHKNHAFIEKCAKNNPDILFIVSGDDNSKIFKEEEKEEISNMIYTGRISDEKMKALYSKCKAFIFPSRYEGFGIPPLEAINCECKNVIVSDIPVFREIYGDNVRYIDLNNEDSESKNILNKIKKEMIINKHNINKYSWENTAKAIIDNLEDKI